MSFKFDNLIRLTLVMLVVSLDIHHHPLPLTVVEKNVIEKAFKNCKDGRCPFILYPPLHESTADDIHRISIYNKSLSLFGTKAISYFQYILNQNYEQLIDSIYKQLTQSIPETVSHSTLNQIFNSFIVTFSSTLLLDNTYIEHLSKSSPFEERFMSMLTSKTIFLYYVIGSADITVDSSTHFYLFFTILSLFAAMNRMLRYFSTYFEKDRLKHG
jgi:hypothetical protein